MRRLKSEREATANALKATEAHTGAKGGTIDAKVSMALAGLYDLRGRLVNADRRIARGALLEIVERIDLEFEHTKHERCVRSHFERGTVRFKVCNPVQATWPELAQLPAVGQVLAQRIVDSRRQQGPSADHDDLLRVNGIGPLTLEKIKPYLLPMPDQQDVAGTAVQEPGTL